MPSEGLLQAVGAYLDRRRVVGTHVDVVGPGYTEIGVTARVRARVGADQTTVRNDVIAALRALFDPLSGGMDGDGWPFGRTVYRAEVLQAIDGVPGVDTVLSMTMSADGQPAQCGNVCIGPTQLITSGQHVVEVVAG